MLINLLTVTSKNFFFSSLFDSYLRQPGPFPGLPVQFSKGSLDTSGIGYKVISFSKKKNYHFLQILVTLGANGTDFLGELFVI